MKKSEGSEKKIEEIDKAVNEGTPKSEKPPKFRKGIPVLSGLVPPFKLRGLRKPRLGK